MPQPNRTPLVFIGAYTHTTAYPVCRVFRMLSESRHSGGIYVCRFNGETGELEPLSSASGAENPSFLATHPNGRFLYAASEIQEFEGQPQGALCAYAIDADAGRLEFINSVGSGGQGPCRVRVDATGRFLLAANYHRGSVCVAPVGDGGGLEPLSCFIQHEGASGVNPARQDKAHAHSINPDADNRFAYVPDLGQDRIVIYPLRSENGTLALADAPYAEAAPGAGPRHLAFHPHSPPDRRRRAYPINQLPSAITAFDRDDETGAPSAIQTISAPPPGFARANATADIRARPSRKLARPPNRGHRSIAAFPVGAATGGLTALGHEPTQGIAPRNFAIDPSGQFPPAANQDSDSAATLRIDADTNAPTPTGAVADISRRRLAATACPSSNGSWESSAYPVCRVFGLLSESRHSGGVRLRLPCDASHNGFGGIVA